MAQEPMSNPARPTKDSTAKSPLSLSFASVAAMAPPEAEGLKTGSSVPAAAAMSSVPALSLRKDGGPSTKRSPEEVRKDLHQAFDKLDVKDFSAAVSELPEHAVPPTPNFRPRLDDEKTHLSCYSATAPSLDGKSVASGTTFGLDEKESLRPDDSASVKATEDDDSNSGPASGDPNSRVGSDTGAKAFRDQFTEISDRVPPGVAKQLPWVRRSAQGAVEELRRSALSSPSSGNVLPPEPSEAEAQQPNPVFAYKYQEQPDEKLLEAMESPKDRLFLLQLEQQVIAFIRDSNDQLLSLPPCNSFYRLLSHRLGDYYALSHFVDNSVSHVKLFRTPFCQLRTPLSEIAQKLAGPVDSRPILPSMKIMRRTGATGDDQTTESGANTTEPSIGPSNTGSEAGDESTKLSGVASPTDSSGLREKPALTSREVREAKYKEARERIFGDFKESDKVEQNIEDASSDVHIQAAISGKKKKKNKNIDESFDSRSSYNLYYPAAYRTGQVYEQGAIPMVNNYGYMQPVNTQVYQNMYQQPYQPYSPMPMPQQMPNYQMPPPGGPLIPTTGMYPQQAQTSQHPSFGLPLPQPYYNVYQPPPQIAGIPPSYPSPAPSNHSTQSSRPQSQMSDQSWVHVGTSGPYVHFQGGNQGYYQPSQQPMPPGPNNPSAMSYPYGQLPYQPPGNASRPAHPVPGSYNRLNFNPQSRIFVPGQFDGSENVEHFNSSAHIPFSSSPHQHVAFNPQAPQMSPMRSPNLSHSSSPRKPLEQSSKAQSPGQSSLSKWGAPANLPPKPPPPATAMDSKSEQKD